LLTSAIGANSLALVVLARPLVMFLLVMPDLLLDASPLLQSLALDALPSARVVRSFFRSLEADASRRREPRGRRRLRLAPFAFADGRGHRPFAADVGVVEV